ncbi:MAG: hypothetical protein JXQ27_15045, partial [Acidobacteria bacterium]|nr:hypothetical protein [Acidobacteriota bacterium]
SEQEYYLVNPSGAYRDYNAVMFRFNKNFSDRWSLRYSLVWSRLEGNTFGANSYADEWEDLNGLTNADGKLPNNNEWESKLTVSYDFPWDIYATAYYLYLSGEYWTPYAVFEGLWYNDRAPVFLTERGSQQFPGRHLFDLKVSKSFRFSGQYRLDFSVDFFNLFDKRTTRSLDNQWGWYVYDYTDHPAGSFWDSNGGYRDVLSTERPREIRFGVRFFF